MKKLIAAFALIATVAVAAPASANDSRNHDRGRGHQEVVVGGANYAEQLERLQQRVYMGAQRGDLNRYEARRFNADIRALDNLRRDYRRSNGFSPREVRDLDRRIDGLRYAINSEIREDRYADRGRDDHDGRRGDWDRR